MNPILKRNLYFVKEYVGMFKAANNFDIYNPDNQDMIMNCREENLGFFTKLFRFTGYKRMTPFNVVIKTISGDKVLTIKRGLPLFISNIEVFDENDHLVGCFKQKFFSIGRKFNVFDANENHLCSLKGKWTSWDFKFLKDEVELAHVIKKWAGIEKEVFKTEDSYILKIQDNVPSDHPIRVMILAAVMCIDMVLKE